VTISDRPGGLARLAEIIAAAGASIKEIVHDQAFSGRTSPRCAWSAWPKPPGMRM
jgi:hypothetical protein